MKCRVCDSETNFLESVEGCQCEQFSFKKMSFSNKVGNVDLFKCPVCSHVQSEYKLADDFYDSYSLWEGVAQYTGSKELAVERIMKLKHYMPTATSVIDIGCGIGSFLEVAKDYFPECYGIEPSENADLPHSANVKILKGYFGSEAMTKVLNTIHMYRGGGYDIITAFQVFEHLSDIRSLLQNIYEMLVPGGVMLLNVPNGCTILRNSLYHQIVHEHINYFTPQSLSVFACQAGFEILEIEDDIPWMELNLYIRKPMEYNGFNALRSLQKKKLAELLAGYKNISIWGAGAKSRTYTQLLPKDIVIRHLFDGNESKAGLFASGIQCPVELPSEDILSKVDALIIFASSYNKPILGILNDEFHYKGRIIYFEDSDVRHIDIK